MPVLFLSPEYPSEVIGDRNWLELCELTPAGRCGYPGIEFPDIADWRFVVPPIAVGRSGPPALGLAWMLPAPPKGEAMGYPVFGSVCTIGPVLTLRL